MASKSKTTTDHDEIPQWVEDHDGNPPSVRGTEGRRRRGCAADRLPGWRGRINWSMSLGRSGSPNSTRVTSRSSTKSRRRAARTGLLQARQPLAPSAGARRAAGAIMAARATPSAAVDRPPRRRGEQSLLPTPSSAARAATEAPSTSDFSTAESLSSIGMTGTPMSIRTSGMQSRGPTGMASCCGSRSTSSTRPSPGDAR